jgi:uncharacterized protein
MDKLLVYVKEILSNSPEQCKGHDFPHILRVYEIGKEIGQKENADMNILKPSLLLHDIVSPSDKREEHATISANYARYILSTFNYNPEDIEKIYSAIISHSRSSNNSPDPISLEAKILYDADKVDGVGKQAIKRVERMFADMKEGSEWYLNRILDVLKNEPMYTELGQKLMNERLGMSLDWCKKQLGEERYNEIAKKYN